MRHRPPWLDSFPCLAISVRRTKIVTTLGPAWDRPPRRNLPLLDAGVNASSASTRPRAHPGDQGALDHMPARARPRRLGILLDLQGPPHRIARGPDTPAPGQLLAFCAPGRGGGAQSPPRTRGLPKRLPRRRAPLACRGGDLQSASARQSQVYGGELQRQPPGIEGVPRRSTPKAGNDMVPQASTTSRLCRSSAARGHRACGRWCRGNMGLKLVPKSRDSGLGNLCGASRRVGRDPWSRRGSSLRCGSHSKEVRKAHRPRGGAAREPR